MFYDRFDLLQLRTRDGDAVSMRAWARRLTAEVSVQDWLVFGYMSVLIMAVYLAPDSAGRTMNLQRLSALMAVFLTTLVAVRGALLGRSLFASLLYRLVMLGTVLGSYFMLKGLLPVVNSGALDAPLYHLDLRLFGFEPAVVLDRFVTPITTEWFAFFYYSYFFVLAFHVIPMLLLSRRMKDFTEFSLGFLGVYCIAHIVYMIVPGYGPYRFLAHLFDNQLPVGFWYERVLEMVNSAGAQKDIFPSLHTAGPTYCVLYSFAHRDHAPFKYTWPVTAFFTANIIAATMFLRWHYLIDVLAGITLAVTVHVASRAIAARELAWRERRGLQPVWANLWPDRPRSQADSAPAATETESAPAR